MYLITFALGWLAGHLVAKYKVTVKFVGGFNVTYVNKAGVTQNLL